MGDLSDHLPGYDEVLQAVRRSRNASVPRGSVRSRPRSGAVTRLLGDRGGDPASPAAGRLGRQGHRPARRRSSDGVPGRQGRLVAQLKYMRAFAAAWPDGRFVQRGLAQLSWHHHVALLDKLDDPDLRYALSRAPRPKRSVACGWCTTVRSGHVWRTCGPSTWLVCRAHQSGRGRLARGVPCVH